MTRRDLLQNIGFTLAAQSVLKSTPAGLSKTYDWIRSPRILIAEAYNPPFYPSLDYDPQVALRIAKELNSDALRYPAASYYAYFPTKTKYPIHPELKGDPMQRTVELFHDAGLRVVAYIPLNHPFMDIRSKNLDYQNWTKRFADGRPMTTSHYGFARFYEGCLNSPLRDQIKDLVREVLVNYPVEVMYFDGPYQGMENARNFCHCRYCKAAYRQARGKAIPKQGPSLTLADEIEYYEWMRGINAAFLREIREMIRQTRDTPVLYNDTGLLSRREWRARDFPVADGFMFEAAETPEEKLFNLQLGRSTGKTIWTYVGSHTEYNREHMKDSTVRGWYSYPVEGQELLLDGATAIAAGVGLVYWGLPRFFYMPKGPLSYESGKYVKENFDLIAKHDALLRSLGSQPKVGILVGSQTIDWYTGTKFVARAYSNYFHGAFQLCKENGIDAEPFLDYRMKPEQLARYKLLYVPNAPCLSDAQCAMIADYVEQGGSLIATHLTSTADEYGRPRKDFALRRLFGITLEEQEALEYPDLYLLFPNGDMIPQDPQITRFRVTDAEVLAQTRDRGNRRTLGPAIVQRGHGKGRIVYVGSGLEAIYQETRIKTLRHYFSSLLDSLVGAHRTYSVEHRSGLMPHLMASQNTLLLHLLADTGDKWQKLRAREEFLPILNVRVRIRIPDGRRVDSVMLLRSGEKVPHTAQAGWIQVTVPRIFVHEAVRVELA